jgi:hypothetical protein
MAIQCFDGKTTDLLKLLAREVTVRLSQEVYEGLQQLHSRTERRYERGFVARNV